MRLRAAKSQPVDGRAGVLLESLLVKTSRTFALSIPALPEPTRQEVTVAYLLFRIADTLEDATLWPRAKKVAELGHLAATLQRPTMGGARSLAARWIEEPPLAHGGYLELLSELPAVLEARLALSAAAGGLIDRHTLRTIDGMACFVSQESGGVVRLRDLEDLRTYCYAVAGIVGEMLTELFLLEREQLSAAAPLLRRDSATFGEALQLVNILKDSASDEQEGRSYLPAGIDRASVFALARRDLQTAGCYSWRLRESGAPRGIVEFTLLPILLARSTLDRVERDGAGAKLTRDEVQDILVRMNQALDAGELAEFCPSLAADGPAADRT